MIQDWKYHDMSQVQQLSLVAFFNIFFVLIRISEIVLQIVITKLAFSSNTFEPGTALLYHCLAI